MKNKLVVGTIVGQAIVTLVAIGYGASAHSSWEAERQRRMDGERAAVAEMAAAMKGAGERLDKVEQELKRCRGRARRAARPRPATSAPVAEPAPTPTPVAFSTDDSFRLLAGPIAWASPPSVEPRPEPVAARVTPLAPPTPAWCEGRYDRARGTNFAPCPPPRGALTAEAPARTAAAHGRP